MISKEYIAGFIDGEGYIGLLRRKRKDLILGYFYKPNVKVTQRTKYNPVLKRLQEQYGGYVTTKAQSIATNQNAIDVWEIANRPMVKQLLLDIRDYSIVKRLIIDLMLEFIELPTKNKPGSEIHDSRKDEIYAELRVLNKRGLAETK